MTKNVIYDTFYQLCKIFSDFYYCECPIIDKIDNVFYFLLMTTHNSINPKETFYLNNDYVLRTHTSSLQKNMINKMIHNNIRKTFTGGVVFRKDDSSRHSYFFHQIDGLFYVDNVHEGIKTLMSKISKIFNKKIKYEIREAYFPFTYPSYEIYLYDECSNTYIEILGCGMMHSKIFQNINEKPKKIFAFGLGVERLAMIKYNINNIKKLKHTNIVK
ncbi:Phenylalanine--tRNA ligase alpha subunit [bacterium AB1]|nr:Phenylalanine--tRNA ligase alpha subunit [bacterium AB1]